MTKNKKKKAAKGYKDIDLISPRKAMAMGYHMGGSITAPAQGPGGQSPMQRPMQSPLMQRPMLQSPGGQSPMQRPTRGPMQRPTRGPMQRPGGQSPMQRPTRGPMQRPTGRRGFSGLGSIARRFGVR
jgi:hypothetical protein